MKLAQHKRSKIVHIPALGNFSRPGHVFAAGRSLCGARITHPTFREIEADLHTMSNPVCRTCWGIYPY